MIYDSDFVTFKNSSFYCRDKIYKKEVLRFSNREKQEYAYMWSDYYGYLSVYFLEYKMHVFSIIINKGFRI